MQTQNRTGATGGPIPEDQRPGHHPEQEQDKPVEAFVQRAKERAGNQDRGIDKRVLGVVLALASVAAIAALIRFRRRGSR